MFRNVSPARTTYVVAEPDVDGSDRTCAGETAATGVGLAVSAAGERSRVAIPSAQPAAMRPIASRIARASRNGRSDTAARATGRSARGSVRSLDEASGASRPSPVRRGARG